MTTTPTESAANGGVSSLPVRFLSRSRPRPVLLAWAALIGAVYVLLTFDPPFLLGKGPFWANPRGPWLIGPEDRIDNIDILGAQVGYQAFLRTPWGLPLFYVPTLGAPAGVSIVYTDSIPLVALVGKVVTTIAGVAVNPYGVWVGSCFVLSAVFAALLVAELGETSLLAAGAAAVLSISAPPLLHRFGHLGLMGHFTVIGALFLYLRDRRSSGFWSRTAPWAAWITLSLLITPYLFAMVVAVYAASLLRRAVADPRGLRPSLAEAGIVGSAVLVVMITAGYLGKGTGGAPSASGFGWYSMNLISPFWPQRSGLFPGMGAIVDATNGQYEGFNYLGFGAVLIVGVAIATSFDDVKVTLRRHRYLAGVFFGLSLYAISHRVFLGNVKLLDLDFNWRIGFYLGMFRASGRMFWPVFYALELFGLALVLRRLSPRAGVGFVLACCLLQLVDTDPLRGRMATLTRRDVPPKLDQSEWVARMQRASAVRVEPTFVCSGHSQHAAERMELELAAVLAGRPTNCVDHTRPNDKTCDAEAAAVRAGPLREDTLYVFFAGEPRSAPVGWAPAGLSCQPFSLGLWCLGGSGAQP